MSSVLARKMAKFCDKLPMFIDNKIVLGRVQFEICGTLSLHSQLGNLVQCIHVNAITDGPCLVLNPLYLAVVDPFRVTWSGRKKRCSSRISDRNGLTVKAWKIRTGTSKR